MPYLIKLNQEADYVSPHLNEVAGCYVEYCKRHDEVRHTSTSLYENGDTHRHIIGFVSPTGEVYGEPVRPLLYSPIIKPVAPVVNINGTDGRALLDQYSAAMRALTEAMSALQAASPNGRDFQTAKPGVFNLAQKQHAERIAQLDKIAQDIEAVAIQVSDQITR